MLTSDEISKYKKDGFVVPNFTMPEKDLIEIDLSLSTSTISLYFFNFFEKITEKLLLNIKTNRCTKAQNTIQ